MKTTFTPSLKHLAALLVLAVVLSGCVASGTSSGVNESLQAPYPPGDYNFSGQPTTNGTNNEVKS